MPALFAGDSGLVVFREVQQGPAIGTKQQSACVLISLRKIINNKNNYRSCAREKAYFSTIAWLGSMNCLDIEMDAAVASTGTSSS